MNPKVVKKQDVLSKIAELDERNEEVDLQHSILMAQEAMESVVYNQQQLQVVDQCKRENINSLARFMHLMTFRCMDLMRLDLKEKNEK